MSTPHRAYPVGVHLAIAGSVATDHLMTFHGTFADSLVPEELDKISLSFLVDELEIRRGGCAANISFGLGALGHRPTMIASVGRDFDDLGYRRWLQDVGVDCHWVRVSDTRHTARFVCTTDSTHAQIATFYTGAMAEAREIDIAEIHARTPIDLLLIGPDDPEAMRRHTRAARELGLPFAADPSQQLAWAEGDLIAELVDGATYLFSNDYEAALIQKKTGWSDEEVQRRVGTRVVTHGKRGVVVHGADGSSISVAAIPDVDAVDPTGVGDSFRAGFLAGVAAGLDFERSAQIGCTIAAGVVETTGTQEYELKPTAFVARFASAYGASAAAQIAGALGWS